MAGRERSCLSWRVASCVWRLAQRVASVNINNRTCQIYAQAPRWWQGLPDGLVSAMAREDGAVSTSTPGVAQASGSDIGRRISDGQHQCLDTEILTGCHTILTCVGMAAALSGRGSSRKRTCTSIASRTKPGAAAYKKGRTRKQGNYILDALSITYGSTPPSIAI
jgi:hypothetical protein